METTYQVIPQKKAIDQKKLHNKTKQEKQVNVRRTQPQVFQKRTVARNLTKFTAKQLRCNVYLQT